MKVIFHIDEMSKWGMVLSNVLNLKESDHTAEISVLANGEAVSYYKKHREKIENLINKDIVFLACNNSLKSRRIKPEDLMNGIEIVPVGVYELALKQQEGYAYIRP